MPQEVPYFVFDHLVNPMTKKGACQLHLTRPLFRFLLDPTGRWVVPAPLLPHEQLVCNESCLYPIEGNIVEPVFLTVVGHRKP